MAPMVPSRAERCHVRRSGTSGGPCRWLPTMPRWAFLSRRAGRRAGCATATSARAPAG
jgi:hypothetical protein